MRTADKIRIRDRIGTWFLYTFLGIMAIYNVVILISEGPLAYLKTLMEALAALD